MPPMFEIAVNLILAVVGILLGVIAFFARTQIARTQKDLDGIIRNHETFRNLCDLAHARCDLAVAQLQTMIGERQTTTSRTANSVEAIQRDYVTKDDLRRSVDELIRRYERERSWPTKQ